MLGAQSIRAWLHTKSTLPAGAYYDVVLLSPITIVEDATIVLRRVFVPAGNLSTLQSVYNFVNTDKFGQTRLPTFVVLGYSEHIEHEHPRNEQILCAAEANQIQYCSVDECLDSLGVLSSRAGLQLQQKVLSAARFLYRSDESDVCSDTPAARTSMDRPQFDPTWLQTMLTKTIDGGTDGVDHPLNGFETVRTHGLLNRWHTSPRIVFRCPACRCLAWSFRSEEKQNTLFCGFDQCAVIGPINVDYMSRLALLHHKQARILIQPISEINFNPETGTILLSDLIGAYTREFPISSFCNLQIVVDDTNDVYGRAVDVTDNNQENGCNRTVGGRVNAQQLNATCPQSQTFQVQFDKAIHNPRPVAPTLNMVAERVLSIIAQQLDGMLPFCIRHVLHDVYEYMQTFMIDAGAILRSDDLFQFICKSATTIDQAHICFTDGVVLGVQNALASCDPDLSDTEKVAYAVRRWAEAYPDSGGDFSRGMSKLLMDPKNGLKGSPARHTTCVALGYVCENAKSRIIRGLTTQFDEKGADYIAQCKSERSAVIISSCNGIEQAQRSMTPYSHHHLMCQLSAKMPTSLLFTDTKGKLAFQKAVRCATLSQNNAFKYTADAIRESLLQDLNIDAAGSEPRSDPLATRANDDNYDLFRLFDLDIGIIRSIVSTSPLIDADTADQDVAGAIRWLSQFPDATNFSSSVMAAKACIRRGIEVVMLACSTIGADVTGLAHSVSVCIRKITSEMSQVTHNQNAISDAVLMKTVLKHAAYSVTLKQMQQTLAQMRAFSDAIESATRNAMHNGGSGEQNAQPFLILFPTDIAIKPGCAPQKMTVQIAQILIVHGLFSARLSAAHADRSARFIAWWQMATTAIGFRALQRSHDQHSNTGTDDDKTPCDVPKLENILHHEVLSMQIEINATATTRRDQSTADRSPAFRSWSDGVTQFCNSWKVLRIQLLSSTPALRRILATFSQLVPLCDTKDNVGSNPFANFGAIGKFIELADELKALAPEQNRCYPRVRKLNTLSEWRGWLIEHNCSSTEQFISSYYRDVIERNISIIDDSEYSEREFESSAALDIQAFEEVDPQGTQIGDSVVLQSVCRMLVVIRGLIDRSTKEFDDDDQLEDWNIRISLIRDVWNIPVTVTWPPDFTSQTLGSTTEPAFTTITRNIWLHNTIETEVTKLLEYKRPLRLLARLQEKLQYLKDEISQSLVTLRLQHCDIDNTVGEAYEDRVDMYISQLRMSNAHIDESSIRELVTFDCSPFPSFVDSTDISTTEFASKTTDQVLFTRWAAIVPAKSLIAEGCALSEAEKTTSDWSDVMNRLWDTGNQIQCDIQSVGTRHVYPDESDALVLPAVDLLRLQNRLALVQTSPFANNEDIKLLKLWPASHDEDVQSNAQIFGRNKCRLRHFLALYKHAHSRQAAVTATMAHTQYHALADLVLAILGHKRQRSRVFNKKSGRQPLVFEKNMSLETYTGSRFSGQRDGLVGSALLCVPLARLLQIRSQIRTSAKMTDSISHLESRRVERCIAVADNTPTFNLDVSLPTLLGSSAMRLNMSYMLVFANLTLAAKVTTQHCKI